MVTQGSALPRPHRWTESAVKIIDAIAPLDEHERQIRASAKGDAYENRNEAGKKYPMVLSVHGGPAGMYGFDWAQSHEFQVYAAHGWAVFFTNPRGSTGYGEKFDRGVQLHWGDKPYTDIMNGVDAVIAKNPWIDAERLGVTGGSYGGFMTNWIISHTTRFKAAVTLRSISNFISDDGTRDGQYGHEEDFGGDIFEQFDAYWNTSPLKYVKNVTRQP